MKLFKTLSFLVLLPLSLWGDVIPDYSFIQRRSRKVPNANLSFEKIILEERQGKFHVRVEFFFVGDFNNISQIAFPETEWYKLNNLNFHINGYTLIPSRKSSGSGFFQLNNGRYTAYYYSKIKNIKAKRNRLVVTYNFQPSIYDTKGTGHEFLYAEYILKTGASWKGNIGVAQAEIRLDRYNCKDLLFLSDSYRGKCSNVKLWQMKLVNFEPDRDIRFLLPNKGESSLHRH
ncbi:MAG: hypothetical protein AAF518_04760 [Spirochaetota bacterium]